MCHYYISPPGHYSYLHMARLHVHFTIYRRLRIGRNGISTNPKPTIYRNLYENTDPVAVFARENFLLRDSPYTRREHDLFADEVNSLVSRTPSAPSGS